MSEKPGPVDWVEIFTDIPVILNAVNPFKSLTSSRSNENSAGQLQQDNRGFRFEATGKYKVSFACFMIAGIARCAAGMEPKDFEKSVHQMQRQLWPRIRLITTAEGLV